MVAEKSALRTTLLAARRAAAPAARSVAAGRLRAAVAELLVTVRPKIVAGYVPVGTEPGASGGSPHALSGSGQRPGEASGGSPHALSGSGQRPGEASGGSPHALPKGVPVLLPVLLPDSDLDWAYGDLIPGPGRLFEPSGPRLGVDAIATADLVFVPAVAVAFDGSRLGRGGGSYDRALARVRPGVPIVALVYDNEFLPRVPVDPHDRPITGVITPNGGFECLPRHVD